MWGTLVLQQSFTLHMFLLTSIFFQRPYFILPKMFMLYYIILNKFNEVVGSRLAKCSFWHTVWVRPCSYPVITRDSFFVDKKSLDFDYEQCFMFELKYNKCVLHVNLVAHCIPINKVRICRTDVYWLWLIPRRNAKWPPKNLVSSGSYDKYLIKVQAITMSLINETVNTKP